MSRLNPLGLLAVVALAALVFSAFSGGSAQAGGEVRQEVMVKLMHTKAFPHVMGVAELELRIDDEGEVDFRARATAEGLTEDVGFSLCVAYIFVDSDESGGGKVGLDGAPEFNYETLSGLKVTIRAGAGDCTGMVALKGRIA